MIEDEINFNTEAVNENQPLNSYELNQKLEEIINGWRNYSTESDLINYLKGGSFSYSY